MTQLPDRLYLLYHELRPSRSSYSYVVETEEFEKQANLFLQLRESGGPGLCPEVTFDDGHISNFEFALPILQTHAIRAWFFITVGWTGRRPGPTQSVTSAPSASHETVQLATTTTEFMEDTAQ